MNDLENEFLIGLDNIKDKKKTVDLYYEEISELIKSKDADIVEIYKLLEDNHGSLILENKREISLYSLLHKNK